MKRGRKFWLDKRNGKVAGVCAGIADYTGIDVTFVRAGIVVVTLLGAFPWTVIAYALAAWIGKPRPAFLYEKEDLATLSGERDPEIRREMRDLDRRLAEIDSYVASPNSRLEREIEQLR